MHKTLAVLFSVLAIALFISPKQVNASAPPPEVWISAQATGGSGTGTAADPYDGSTQPKFDALMTSFQSMPNLTIHLGPGTFRSDVTVDRRWVVESGWIIEGAGMYLTTCQMMGNLAGQHYDHEFFKSPYNVSTDNVIIRDLTVDCNWSELGSTADVGAQGEKYGAIYAVSLGGSHILIERVRHINSHGSWANLDEAFGISLSAPNTGDVTGNIIRDCRAELPQGNYGAPYGLHGWVDPDNIHFVTNSLFYGNYAAGQNNGLTTGFTSGGLNGAFVKNLQVYNNTFVDCQSVFYEDTGSVEGLTVTNNTLVHGWMGVGLVASLYPTWTKDSIEISANNLNLQNRLLSYGSASYGIAVWGNPATNVSIKKNQISFSPNGQGYEQFLTVSASSIGKSKISENSSDNASAGPDLAAPIRGQVKCYNTTLTDNKTVTGQPMTGLEDNYFAPLGKALNFSTRATVGSGDNVLIDGFIVTGKTSKKVLIRAIGPSLNASGVRNSLLDPTLAIYDQSGSLVTSNDNWQDTQASAIRTTGAAPLQKTESALIATLSPGTYTAVMGSKSIKVGVGLIEVYDLAPNDDSTLQNVSTRGSVGVGDNVIIAGFIVGSGQNPTVVARGIGPSLGDAGIKNPLADPVLELRDGNGQLLAMNDNWKDTQKDAILATGLAPTQEREAAIMQSLPAGNYTAILKGNRRGTGVALVELYTLK